MSLPYLGSKNRLAKQIFDVIAEREKSKQFVDLLCGGFANAALKAGLCRRCNGGAVV